jgi:signal transduction histidine kinase
VASIQAYMDDGVPKREAQAPLEGPPGSHALRAVLDALPGGVALLVGLELRVAYLNRAYRAMVPPREAEPLGHTVDEVWPSAEGMPGRAFLLDALEAGRPTRLEGVGGQSPDGRARTFSLQLSPLDLGGAAVLLIMATETTEVFDAIRRAEEGERRAERHAAALDAVFRSREDLLRMLSHDVRTPLTVVLNHAELLGRSPDADPAEIARRAGAIATSARRIAAMVSDLVDMTQLEAGQVRLAPRRLAFREFALELRGRLAGAVAAERVDVEAAPGDAVVADPDRLERVLVNLLSNALKYAPAETRVALTGRAERGAFVISVRDHGPGIPDDQLPRIFERFYRAPATAEKPGLGLGLHVARLLTEAHGGRIEVESRAGEGATFRVILPDRDGADEERPR